MSADGARGLISMGLEIDADMDDHGTLASAPLLDLIGEIDSDCGMGLLEILSSLARAADGAADIHKQASLQEALEPFASPDGDLDDTVARLKRFAAHIEAARKEIA